MYIGCTRRAQCEQRNNGNAAGGPFGKAQGIIFQKFLCGKFGDNGDGGVVDGPEARGVGVLRGRRRSMMEK